MSEGTANEKKVLKGIASFLTSNSDVIRVKEIVSTGLLVNANSPWMGTSVDGLCEVRVINDSESTGKIIKCMAAIEIKTHDSNIEAECRELARQYGSLCFVCTGPSSSLNREEIQSIEYLRRAVGLNIEGDSGNDNDMASEPYFELTIEDVIPNAMHRTQIIHHASTMNLASGIVLFVDASPSKIIRIVFIYVLSIVKESYSCLLNGVAEKYLGWIYNVGLSSVVPVFSRTVLGHCSDMHTLYLTHSLRQKIFQLFEDNGCNPLPRSSKLCPALLTKWNTTKGGVDVDTRLSANNKAPFQHLGVELKLWDTLIMKACTIAYHMQGWCSIEPTLDSIQNTDALLKLKRRIPFHKYLAGALSMINFSNSKRVTESNVSDGIKWSQDYFISEAGIDLRTSHSTFFKDSSASQCKVCGTKHRSQYMCRDCGVYLCVTIKDGIEPTCFEYFHSKEAKVLHRLTSTRHGHQQPISHDYEKMNNFVGRRVIKNASGRSFSGKVTGYNK